MAGNITNELVGKLGMKILSKGVKVDVTEEHVSVDLSLNIKYGYNIPEVSERVQERVKSAIENMTGLTVLDVNVKISVSARNGYAPCSFFKIPVIKISFVDFLLQSAIMRFRETCNSREQQKRQLFPAAGNK